MKSFRVCLVSKIGIPDWKRFQRLVSCFESGFHFRSGDHFLQKRLTSFPPTSSLHGFLHPIPSSPPPSHPLLHRLILPPRHARLRLRAAELAAHRVSRVSIFWRQIGCICGHAIYAIDES
ncbi:hypothetical protein Droror1_Dr00017111 [Drosera rotundifolia]